MQPPVRLQAWTTAPAGGPQVVRRRVSGVGSSRDEVVLEEADPARFLQLGRTKDGAYVTINSSSKTSSEVRRVLGVETCTGQPPWPTPQWVLEGSHRSCRWVRPMFGRDLRYQAVWGLHGS